MGERTIDVAQPTSDVRQSVTGVPALDTLIGGGLYDGSTTMVVGVSGAGKTVLGTHLLREGILQHGKKGLLVSLDEHPAQIIRNAAAIGPNLQPPIDDGKLRISLRVRKSLTLIGIFAELRNRRKI